VATLAEIVGASMNDNGALVTSQHQGIWKKEKEETYADDALGADQLDQLVCVASLSIALGVGLEVTQVTNVALLVGWGTVCLVVRVDCHRLSMYIVAYPAAYKDLQ